MFDKLIDWEKLGIKEIDTQNIELSSLPTTFILKEEDLKNIQSKDNDRVVQFVKKIEKQITEEDLQNPAALAKKLASQFNSLSENK